MGKKQLRVSEFQPHLGGNFIGGDPNTLFIDLWAWFIKQYKIVSVFDVGCAEGHALREFQKLGCTVFGIDGLRENIDFCADIAKIHDLNNGPFLLDKLADLVWCCELVEHVDEKYLNNVVTTLAQGTYIAMTHGIPRQRGYYHVNCKDDKYWISELSLVGYEFLELDTKETRELFKKTYWENSGLIFKKGLNV